MEVIMIIFDINSSSIKTFCLFFLSLTITFSIQVFLGFILYRRNRNFLKTIFLSFLISIPLSLFLTGFMLRENITAIIEEVEQNKDYFFNRSQAHSEWDMSLFFESFFFLLFFLILFPNFLILFTLLTLCGSILRKLYLKRNSRKVE